ncbi:MAG: hypothetical protein WC708_00215 [Lentisphaeria bacterium]
MLSEHGMDTLAVQAVIDELNTLPKLRVASSDVRIIDNTAVALVVLRGRLNGKKVQRTIYSGINIFIQLMQRWSVPTDVIPEIRSLVQEDVDELEKKVREATSRLTSDEKVVEEVRSRFRVLSRKAKQVKRTNLIATMTALLTVGWTREEIITCLDEATCKNVLES